MGDAITRLVVRRGAPGSGARYDSFDVPYRDGDSVLDALRRVRAEQDATVAVRFSCINANACKECMIQVDGTVEYACLARLVPGEMRLDPLPNKPWIRDLVTEIAPPAERWKPS